MFVYLAVLEAALFAKKHSGRDLSLPHQLFVVVC